jgi:hypothetical protein
MGSPVIANYYMEDFEERALDLPPPSTSPSAGFATWATPSSSGPPDPTS